MKCLVVTLLLFFSMYDACRAFECPNNQYPYGGCSSCFNVIDQVMDFNSANQFCQEQGATLVSIEGLSHLSLLSRYLEGLLEERRLWLGYRYNSDGSRVDLDGNSAPSVIQDNENFAGAVAGGVQTCIAIQGSSFVNVPCSETLVFACMYTYGVPQVIASPDSRIVYVATSQTNFALSATIVTPGASLVTAQWRFNDALLVQDQTTYIVTAEDGQSSKERVFSLVIGEFDPSMHSGTYELLVQGLTGIAVSATWQLKEPVIGSITIQPQDLTIPQGQIAAFECKAENALPSATVTWYRDGSPLVVSERLYVSDVTGTLFIRDVGISDAGVYRCECVNGAGSVISETARLTIAADAGSEMTSNFFINPRPLTILAGQPFNLECVGLQTHDISSTEYSFFFDQPFFNTMPDRRFVYPSDSGFPFFRIDSVYIDNSTVCTTCVIGPGTFQGFGALMESNKVPLTVHSLAKVTNLTTGIQNGIETNSNLIPVPSGSDLTIQCQFSGVPVPTTVEWTRDGNLITVGVVTQGSVSTLSLSGFNMSAVYQCHVENVYGRDTASVYLCLEEPESTPGPVPFLVEPDSNTSIYISWDLPSPLSAHPLLLRYDITVRNIETDLETIHKPSPGNNQFIAPGLLPGSLYRVFVVAKSLLGPGEVIEEEIFVRTFGNPPTEPITDLTVHRTPDNAALIVQWDSVVPANTVSPVYPVYEVQYRMSEGENRTATIVGRQETVFVIEGLNNAASYEVRIRVLTQTRRDPAQFSSGPWSAFVEVGGITTLPSPTTSQPATPPTEPLVSQMGLLLIYILVPVGLLLLVVVCCCILTICCCCKHRRTEKKKYSPSKKERNDVGKSPDQRPMGNQVYDLPLSNCASQVWVENGGYTPNFTPQPQAQSEEPPLQVIPNNNTTVINDRDCASATPSLEPIIATPTLSQKSNGTVTITYLPQNNESSGIDSENGPGLKSESASLNWNGASASSTDYVEMRHPTGNRTSTPVSGVASSTYSMSTPPPPPRDPFGYSYKEASSAASDLYNLAMSMESNLDSNQSRRLSGGYDNLEPTAEKEDLAACGTTQTASTSLSCTPDIDFKVLEDLAAESAAMASLSGTPDPYAVPPTPSDQ